MVGIFPDDPSLIRLASMIAIEANDEWLVGRSYMARHTMALLENPIIESNTAEEAPALQPA